MSTFGRVVTGESEKSTARPDRSPHTAFGQESSVSNACRRTLYAMRQVFKVTDASGAGGRSIINASP